MWRCKSSPPRGRNIVALGSCICLEFPGDRGGDITRRPLLQKQLGSLHDGIAMKTGSHYAIKQRIRDGNDRHALVVRHEGTHDCNMLTFGHAARRVIKGFVKAVTALRACAGETDEILSGGSTMAASAVA